MKDLFSSRDDWFKNLRKLCHAKFSLPVSVHGSRTEKLPQEFTKDFESILSVDNTFLAYSRKTPSPVLIVPKEPEKSSEKIGKGSKSHKDLKRFVTGWMSLLCGPPVHYSKNLGTKT